jgi:polyphenol oxidase
MPQGDPPAWFRFGSLAALGVPHATTTRHFVAVASPAEARPPFTPEASRLLEPAGLDLTRVTYARQVHGAQVARAPAGGGFAGAVDVLVTPDPGLPLAIFTADCLAITLYDPGARVLALAHVGWRGTVGRAGQAAVAALEEAGGRAGRATATIAPSIGPCCYEVDEPVIGEFSARYPDAWERWVAAAGPGRWMLDLWSANEELLVATGLSPDRIENPRLCTACHPELLFSYRKGHPGRLVTVAAIP